LVVGTGLAAAATAGFLQQAGLNPVVATVDCRPKPTEHRVLWRPGLILLERMGLRRPVEQVGTRLDSRGCLTADRTWTAEKDTRPSLVAIDADRLAELVEKYILDTVQTTERVVTGVEPVDSGVRATFDGTVTELFDAVVTTSRSLLQSRPQKSTTTGLHMWSFKWPTELPIPSAPSEAWTEQRAVFFDPVDEVRLVSTAEVTSAAALSIGDLERWFGRLFEEQSPFAELDQECLRYSRPSQLVPTTVSTDGVVLVGSAARGSVLGDCLSPTLGLEDAWVLADALAYGPVEIAAAVDEYEHRRRRRARAIASFVADKSAIDTCPVDTSPSLSRLHARRTLAFSHVHGGQPHTLAESIPHRL
jgi:2-polyprenyl-6-methoxyphenol hydroxylase-like FAD-dependent oxidoreductase